jgi:glycosyltransferase involved in cell wall biosynthesis
VPVVATDVGELAAMVREWDLGELYRYGDAAGLATAVTRATERYAALLGSVAVARESLVWEVEQDRLREVYRRLTTRS